MHVRNPRFYSVMLALLFISMCAFSSRANYLPYGGASYIIHLVLAGISGILGFFCFINIPHQRTEENYWPVDYHEVVGIAELVLSGPVVMLCVYIWNREHDLASTIMLAAFALFILVKGICDIYNAYF